MIATKRVLFVASMTLVAVVFYLWGHVDGGEGRSLALLNESFAAQSPPAVSPVLDGDIGQPLIVLQVPREAHGNVLSGSRVCRGVRADSFIAQEVQQQPQRVQLPAAHLKASRSALPTSALVPHDIILTQGME